MGQGWFILGMIVVGLAAAYFAWRHQQARREAMAALANELGWVFLADGVRHDDADFFSKLMGLVAAGGTRVAEACSVCYGSADGPMIDAARLGVWLLFGLVLAIQLAFGTFFVSLWRRARRYRRENPDARRAD